VYSYFRLLVFLITRIFVCINENFVLRTFKFVNYDKYEYHDIFPNRFRVRQRVYFISARKTKWFKAEYERKIVSITLIRLTLYVFNNYRFRVTKYWLQYLYKLNWSIFRYVRQKTQFAPRQRNLTQDMPTSISIKLWP